MSVSDDEFNIRLSSYTKTQFQRYINWYAQNAKLAKNNLIAGLAVIVICALCLAFFPVSMDEMEFLQYTFDPSNAIKLGLLASIVFSFVSMYTSSKQRKRCLTAEALLQAEHAQFEARTSDNAGPIDEDAFRAFVSGVDGVMAAHNPEVVIAIERDNAQNQKSSDTPNP